MRILHYWITINAKLLRHIHWGRYSLLISNFRICIFVYSPIHLDSQLVHKQRQIALFSEMVHSASLVHDDVIDQSDFRRGKPSVNALWNHKKVSYATRTRMSRDQLSYATTSTSFHKSNQLLWGNINNDALWFGIHVSSIWIILFTNLIVATSTCCTISKVQKGSTFCFPR